MNFTDKIQEGRSKDCFFCSFNSGTDELTPLPFSCWLPLNNCTWQITSASPISCLVRLHHLIQCSCCRFCSHLLPAKGCETAAPGWHSEQGAPGTRDPEHLGCAVSPPGEPDSQCPLLSVCSAGEPTWGVSPRGKSAWLSCGDLPHCTNTPLEVLHEPASLSLL